MATETMEWVVGASQESYGELGSLGIKIMLAVGRPLTEADKRTCRDAMDTIYAGVMEETIRLRPETAQERTQERAEIVGLFRQPIFVEEISNGYCNSWCCKQKPWFVVTTLIGRVKIGWRKRVISIDWEDSIIKESAENLFPTEDVTKYGRLIHAWSYDKAREYLAVLLKER